jgi:hypothetical protein
MVYRLRGIDKGLAVMAVVWCDGFDKYSAAVDQVPGSMINKYTLGSSLIISNYITKTGRNGGMGIQLLVSNVRSLQWAPASATNTWTVGFAIKYDSVSAFNVRVLELRDGTTSSDIQVMLSMSSGTLTLWRGSFGTNLGSSSTLLTSGVWNYLEVQVTIAQSAAAGGKAELRQNGTATISFTGQTQQTLDTDVSNMFITGDGTAKPTYDDLYVKNDVSSYLGDSKVETLVPSAAGFYSQFSVTPGPNHFSAVNEVPPDDDTSYIYATSAPVIDTFEFPSLAVLNGSIHGVQWSMRAKKLFGAGSHPIQGVVRTSGGTDGFSDSISLLSDTTYAVKTVTEATNPATAANWTLSDINDSQFGVRLVS